tara:strand:+ start:394 stop:1065 length:672 start_codon:yes stop_codon:yes gene_type:complete
MRAPQCTQRPQGGDVPASEELARRAPSGNSMTLAFDAFLVSTGIVALAEIGDKTQLLAFMLAARYRRTGPIVFGILVATIANHACAGALGTWLTQVLGPDLLRWVLGLGFLAMAVWILIPDKLDADEVQVKNGMGVFATTTVAFFLAEMGDKTQVATVALAAQYEAFVAVVLGTTLGMMIANVPAVLVGDRLAHRMPVRLVHAIAAVLFAVLGVVALSGAWEA